MIGKGSDPVESAGMIKLGVASDRKGKMVVIGFPCPVDYLTLTFEETIAFANLLRRKAYELPVP